MADEKGALNTVTISTDEYFELRERASLAFAISERLNYLEERLNNLSCEFYNFKDQGK